MCCMSDFCHLFADQLGSQLDNLRADLWPPVSQDKLSDTRPKLARVKMVMGRTGSRGTVTQVLYFPASCPED